jgi:hypothetical protein
VLVFFAEHRSVSLIFGSALHSTIGWFFGEKLAGGKPTIEDAENVFEADLQAEIAGETIRWGKRHPGLLAVKGKELVALYLEEHERLPVYAVEAQFLVDIEDPETGERLPRRMKGFFDLVLEDGTVVEIKTSASRWNENDLIRHLQLGTYVSAKCVIDGGPAKVIVHVLLKQKKVDLQEHIVERGEPDNRWWFRAAQEIELAIARGHFPPNPGRSCFDCEYARRCASWVHEAPDARRSLPVHRGEHHATHP